MEDQLMTMISQVGFPIAVAGYVLIRMETTIRELTKAVNNMSAKIGTPETTGGV